jgi:hypothetical protein
MTSRVESMLLEAAPMTSSVESMMSEAALMTSRVESMMLEAAMMTPRVAPMTLRMVTYKRSRARWPQSGVASRHHPHSFHFFFFPSVPPLDVLFRPQYYSQSHCSARGFTPRISFAYSHVIQGCVVAHDSQMRSLDSVCAYHFRWILWLLTTIRYAPKILLAPLDSLGADDSQMRSLGSLIPHDSRMRSPGSLVAHPEALGGFCRFSPIFDHWVRSARLDSLVVHHFRWIL